MGSSFSRDVRLSSSSSLSAMLDCLYLKWTSASVDNVIYLAAHVVALVDLGQAIAKLKRRPMKTLQMRTGCVCGVV